MKKIFMWLAWIMFWALVCMLLLSLDFKVEGAPLPHDRIPDDQMIRQGFQYYWGQTFYQVVEFEYGDSSVRETSPDHPGYNWTCGRVFILEKIVEQGYPYKQPGRPWMVYRDGEVKIWDGRNQRKEVR